MAVQSKQRLWDSTNSMSKYDHVLWWILVTSGEWRRTIQPLLQITHSSIVEDVNGNPGIFFKSHLKNHVIDNISNILETNHGILKLNYAQVANDFYIIDKFRCCLNFKF